MGQVVKTEQIVEIEQEAEGRTWSKRGSGQLDEASSLDRVRSREKKVVETGKSRRGRESWVQTEKKAQEKDAEISRVV
jgi:hypothetical protein